MNRANWKDIAELVGIAAIVASLVFVGLEMRQQQVLARAELGSQSFEYMRSIRQAFSDTDFARTYVKMLETPSQLTDAEVSMLNGFFHELIQLVERDCYLVGLGVFVNCTSTMNRFYPEYFGNEYAKNWWLSTKRVYRPRLVEQISPVIEQLDHDVSRRYLGAELAAP